MEKREGRRNVGRREGRKEEGRRKEERNRIFFDFYCMLPVKILIVKAPLVLLEMVCNGVWKIICTNKAFMK